MATTIFLVRHADVHNPRNVFYGRLPRFRISDLGGEQARFLAGRLSADAFYASPMLRARQTARILAGPEAPVRIVSDLIEVRTGWMGTPNEQLPARINLYEPPHGAADETMEEIAARVDRALRRLAGRHAGSTLCCVSHGDPIVIAHALYKGLSMKLDSIRMSWYPQKCSVTTLRFDGGGMPEVGYEDVIGKRAPELVAPH